jgi:uroporphyrinogen III methyltransferase/synthase
LMAGKVYLVGAGPGDPELITLKGQRALRRAAVVLYDHLAPEQLLELAPAAERIYVGKKRSSHAFTQDDINAMLITRAQAGATVVRLKGGDPYLFGRGGEEAEALADAGIPFEVIPGVSSPCGIAAYAGVPLTHRDHASVVSIVTGHEVDAIDWERFGSSETLVILMGLTNFSAIAERIIAAGRSPETPAIAVRWGTRPDQDSVLGTLSTLPEMIRSRGLRPPASVIIGEVVGLHSKLNWFEKLPLFGQRVVVTRPRGQSAGLIARLRDLGAQAIEFPTIAIEAASDYGPLDRAIGMLREYDWLVFTSVNGVHAFFERLDRSGQDLRQLRARLAAIGPATREALEQAHLKVDLTGDEYVAESLAEAFEQHPLGGSRVLLVRAAVAREFLPQALANRGAAVEVVEAYRTVPVAGLEERARELEMHPPDWITFTSSSTVDNFFHWVDAARVNQSKMASIGPVTSATLRKHGVEPAVEASVFTVDGLVEVLSAWR